jgi:hypothetical protein
MRKAGIIITALALLAGCSGNDNDTDGGTGGKELQPGVVMATDLTRILFGQDFGDAVLLGTQPVRTLQIFSNGQQDLVISSIEVVAGTDTDGGALANPTAFTATGPDISTIPGGKTGFVQVVFNPPAVGLYGAILRIHSNATPAQTDVVLSADCVTPTVSLYPASATTDIAVPDITLYPNHYADGGDITYPDGGANWATGFATADVYFENTGTYALQFQPAQLATDAGDAPFYLCTNNVQGGTQCQAGPLPDTVNRAYPDGGVAIRYFTDGGSAPDVAHLQIVFNPAAPGTYNQHVIVDSTATDHPEIVLNVTGRAVANH